jgi:hypothetical protein
MAMSSATRIGLEDMKVMFREAHGIVAEIVGELHEFGQLLQHLLVELGPRGRHAGLDVGTRADAGQAEDRGFHALVSSRFCYPVRVADLWRIGISDLRTYAQPCEIGRLRRLLLFQQDPGGNHA